MGHTSSCVVCQIVTSTAVGKPGIVKKEYQIDEKLKSRVWIDGFNVSGDKILLEAAKKRNEKNCKKINFVLKEEMEIEKRDDFVGVEFDHKKSRVRPAMKTRNKLVEQIPIVPTIGELEKLAGLLVFCSTVNRIPLVKFWFPMKTIRRHINGLNNNTLSVDQKCRLTNNTWSKLEMWRKMATDWHYVEKIHGRGTSHLFIDASEHGWGAVLMYPDSRISIVGARWSPEELPKEGERLNISKLENRAVGKAITTFGDLLLNFETVHLHIDNTSTMHGLRRATVRSEAMAVELLQYIDKLDQRVRWRVSYVSSKNNPSDLPSRPRYFELQNSFRTRSDRQGYCRRTRAPPAVHHHQETSDNGG